MAALNPGKKRSFGNDSWGWITALTVATPKLTELNAVGGVNLSCFLMRDQEGITASVDQVTLDAALCEIDAYQVPGVTTYSLADLRILNDPQGATGSNGRKAWEAMTDGAAGFLWRRQGIRSTTDLAVGDKIDIIPAQLGIKVPIKTSNDPNGVYAFQVSAGITSAPTWGVATIAGP